MTSSKSGVEIAQPVRPIAFVIGIIMVFIVTPIISFFSGILPFSHPYPFGSNVYTPQLWMDITYVFFWPFVILLITSAISKVKRLTKQEIAVIVSMVWVTWFIPTCDSGVKQTVTWVMGARLLPEPWYPIYFMRDMRDIWWFWGPDPNVSAYWDGALTGGSAVPWAQWMFPMVYQCLYLIVFFMTQVFVVNLFRRQWLDVEELPFPMATAGAFLINQSVEPSRGKSVLKSLWLWIGIIIGFLGQLPLLLPCLSTAFPVPDEPFVGIDLTPLGILPWVFLVFLANPELYGAAYLMPTSILLTYIVFWVVLQLIWGPLMVALGIWDPMPAGTTWHAFYGSLCRSWTGVLGQANWAQYFGGTWNMFSWGAMLAMIFWPLWLYRRDAMVILRGLWSKVPREIDEQEPLKVKQTWIGFIVCFVIWFFLHIWGTGGALYNPFYWIPVFLVLVGVLVQWTGLMLSRYFGEVGYGMFPIAGYTCAPPAWNYGLWLMFVHPSSPWYLGPFTNLDAAARRFAASARAYFIAGYSGITQPMPRVFEAYKIGKETGTRYRDQFIGMVIAIIVAVVLTYVFTLIFAYALGINNRWSAPFSDFASGYYLLGWMAHGPWTLVWCCSPEPRWTILVAGAIGFIITVILFQLRAKYPRWPFHPIGFAMVITWMYPQMLLPIIVAYIAKRLTLRFGGSEAYVNKGMPVAIGLIIGFSIAVLLGSVGIAFQKGAL